MREIKFRAIDKIYNVWRYGLIWKHTHHDRLEESKNFVRWYINDDNGSDWEVIPSTICQYTGVKDKNRKEIYEGDLLDYNNGKLKRCEVHYRMSAFWLKNGEKGLLGGLAQYYPDMFEIIGNIHGDENNGKI